MRKLLTGFFVCLWVTGWAHADAVAARRPEGDAVAAAEVVVDGPTSAYEAAVVRAVEGVRARAAKNPDCWLVPPDSPAKVVSYTLGPKRTRRFREVEVKVKRPIYAYETYEALVPGDSAGKMVKKTLTRQKGITGYKESTKKTLVPDPNGTIEQHHQKRIPVYEEGSTPFWRWNHLGLNAFMLYALRAAGVPGTDGLLMPTAEGLAAFVEAFAMPDTTWDLAWMTAAFAVMPGEPYEELTLRCASKLLDGQVDSGGCAGMWGPVCVKPSVMSAVYKVMSEISESKASADAAAQAEMQAALAGRKISKKMSKAELEQIRLEQVMRDVQREGFRVTQLGLRLFLAVHKRDSSVMTVESSDGNTARIQGLPYLIQNQVLTDMESTAIALFALRVASGQKRLPQTTWRPGLKESGIAAARAGIPPPCAASDVIRLAEKGVAGVRLPSRQWSESNRQQSVDDFAWLKSMPQVQGRLPDLDSPVSALATLRGFVALNNIAFFRNWTLPPVPYDDASFMKIADEALAWNALAKNEEELRANAERFVVAGLLSSRFAQAKQERVGTGWERVAQRTLEQQDGETGLWGHPNRRVIWISTGLWARKKSLPQLNYNSMGEFYARAHLTPDLTQTKPTLSLYAVPEWTVNTAGALLLLAEGLGAAWTYPTEGVEYVAPEAAM